MDEEERGNKKGTISETSSNDNCCLLANNSSSSDDQQESSHSEAEEGSDDSSMSGRKPETLAPQSMLRSLPGEKSLDKKLDPRISPLHGKKSAVESEDETPGYQNFTKLVKQSLQKGTVSPNQYSYCVNMIRDSSPDDLE